MRLAQQVGDEPIESGGEVFTSLRLWRGPAQQLHYTTEDNAAPQVIRRVEPSALALFTVGS
jgi:hypothetical protein